jgi:hypothetical protein
MLSQRINNPLAPAALNGLSSIDTMFEDLHFCKSWTVTLDASENLLNQQIPLDANTDFFWFAITLKGVSPNQPFAVRFSDSTGYELSDSYISSMFFQENSNVGVGAPVVFVPSFWMPAGSSIVVDLIEQSGATNGPIAFLIQGLKRYK